MLAFSAFAESPFSSLGGTVRFGSTTQEAIFSKVSAGVAEFVGEADLSANFVVSSLAFVLQSNGATFEFAFTQSADGVKLKPGVSSQDINFTQTANGDILYEEIVPTDNETYTTITPSGTETWTEITPSGTETYTEIDA